MAIWEGKKYRLDKNENFDEYMKELGVGMVLRKMGNSLTPTSELTKNGDEYTLISTTTVKTNKIVFKEGVEFDEETSDGRKVKSVITFDGPNKMIQVQDGKKPTTIVREFTETEMIVTLTIGNLTAKRWYKVIE